MVRSWLWRGLGEFFFSISGGRFYFTFSATLVNPAPLHSTAYVYPFRILADYNEFLAVGDEVGDWFLKGHYGYGLGEGWNYNWRGQVRDKWEYNAWLAYIATL